MQTDKQTDIQRSRQTENQTDREDTQISRQTEKQTDREAGRQRQGSHGNKIRS